MFDEFGRRGEILEQQAIDDKVSAHESAVVPLDEDELPDIVAFRVEFARAVFSMKNGKAVGEDGLPSSLQRLPVTTSRP